MKLKRHMRANIEGMLCHYKRRKMDGLMHDENGDPMSDYEARKFLKEAKGKGWKVIPCGDCEGFDHFGDGCPGHPVIEDIHPLTAHHYAVVLPAGYIPSAIDEYMGTPCIVCSSDEVIDDRLFLPPGSWQFLFTTKEATEEQMIELAGIPVQDVVHGWNRQIFNAWLTAKGCDINKNWAIIQTTPTNDKE